MLEEDVAVLVGAASVRVLRIEGVSSKSQTATFWISCEVRKPSKKFRNGTLPSMAARWATGARSMTSWTLPSASMAKPVWRQAMTSE